VGREARAKQERRDERERARREEHETTRKNPPINQPMPNFGLPGQHQQLLVRPVYRDGDPRNDLPLGGSPGKYRVVFTLARPGILPKPEKEFSFDADLPGDSHLAILPPAVPTPPDNPGATQIRVHAKTEDGDIVFDGFPNAAGFLGRLVTELQANDFRDAQHKAYRALAPTLSNWSAHLDIPIHVWRIHTKSLETRAEQISVVNPYIEMRLAMVAEGAITPEYRGLIGLYREALESRSPVYQFLCFFKIAEGIRGIRDRVAADARRRGEQPPTRPAARIPKDPAEFEPWLNAIYPGRRPWDAMALDSVFVDEARGRKVNDLLDKELTDLRVDIAHALSEETGNVGLDVDEALHVARVNKWLPLMKCIVRRLLKDDFPQQFLSHLKEDGAIAEPSDLRSSGAEAQGSRVMCALAV
jgi:hypothetical protein